MYVVTIPFAGKQEGDFVYPNKKDVAELIERGLIKEASESTQVEKDSKPVKPKEKKKAIVQPEVVDDSKLIKAQ